MTGPIGAGSAERGAALAETIVLMVVLVPLMFAVPMVGNLVDLRQSSVQAARYAAWESTVHPGRAAPAHLSERFFGDGDAPIVTASSDGGTNALWGDGPGAGSAAPGTPVHDTEVRVRDRDVVTLGYEAADRQSAVADTVGGAISAVGGALDALGGTWDVETGAIRRSGVRVGVDRNGWLAELGPGNCGQRTSCFEETAAILGDAWAADRDRAERRVEALVPATALDPVGEAMAVFGNVPFLEELKSLDDAFGHVDMDQVSEAGERGAGRTHYGLEAYEED